MARVLRSRGNDPWRHGSLQRPYHYSSKLFEGIYALYSGLLLIGVTGFILSPVLHRVMHQLHLPDDDDASGDTPKPAKLKSKSKP